jgi:flavin-dependent dehydrogenase
MTADVVVVGGGPAGSAVAAILARDGASVILVDDPPLERDVDLLPGRVRALLETLDGPDPKEADFSRPVTRVLSAWGEAVTETELLADPWGPAWAVERRRFDDALRSWAASSGARVVRPARATSIERRRRRSWRITFQGGSEEAEAEAGHLIFASGRVRPRVMPRRGFPDEIAVTFTARLAGDPAGLDETLLVERLRDGWWYLLPGPHGGWYAGVVMSQVAVKERQRPLWQLVREVQCASGLREVATVHPYGTLRSRPAGTDRVPAATGDGWFSVGDAAFAVDPLSGQGLEFGLESAVRAARSVQRGVVREYRDWVMSYAQSSIEVGEELRGPWAVPLG